MCLGGVKSEGVRNSVSEARDQLTKGGAAGCKQSNFFFISDQMNPVAALMINGHHMHVDLLNNVSRILTEYCFSAL